MFLKALRPFKGPQGFCFYLNFLYIVLMSEKVENVCLLKNLEEGSGGYSYDLIFGRPINKGAFGELYSAYALVKTKDSQRAIPVAIKRFADANRKIKGAPSVSLSITEKDLLKELMIYRRLRAFSRAVLPTFRVNTEYMLAIMTDLHILYPGALIIDRSSNNKPLANICNKTKLFSDLKELSLSTARAGVYLSEDSVFFVADKDERGLRYKTLYVVDLDLLEMTDTPPNKQKAIDYILDKNLKAMRGLLRTLGLASEELYLR